MARFVLDKNMPPVWGPPIRWERVAGFDTTDTGAVAVLPTAFALAKVMEERNIEEVT